MTPDVWKRSTWPLPSIAALSGMTGPVTGGEMMDSMERHMQTMAVGEHESA